MFEFKCTVLETAQQIKLISAKSLVFVLVQDCSQHLTYTCFENRKQDIKISMTSVTSKELILAFVKYQ